MGTSGYKDQVTPISYRKRVYRERLRPKGLECFSLRAEESDLWICAQRNLEKEAFDLLYNLRRQIIEYIAMNRDFLTSFLPIEDDLLAPGIVQEMIRASRKANVGPMASVAGAIAQGVGKGLLEISEEVIVENGGDIYLNTQRPAVVSLFAGSSILSEKFAINIYPEQMPLGVCSSSSTVGHSTSMGRADLACIVAKDAAFADAAATALGNRIQTRDDLEKIEKWVEKTGDIMGGVVILGKDMAAWGEIELTEL